LFDRRSSGGHLLFHRRAPSLLHFRDSGALSKPLRAYISNSPDPVAKSRMQKGIFPLPKRREDRNMKTIFAIVALAAAGLASNGANAASAHRHHAEAGVTRHASATVDRMSFQGLYQGGVSSNDCDGQRVFGFCPVR
jgi:hypothetical protein